MTFDYSNSDYKKLHDKKMTWEAEELSRFLFLNSFEAAAIKSVSAQELQKEFLVQEKQLVKKYQILKHFFSILDFLFLNLHPKKSSKNKKTILFQNAKFPELILNAKNRYNVDLIAEGVRDRLFAIRHHVKYTPIEHMHALILEYLQKKNNQYLYQLVGEAEKRLKKIQPNYIVLWDDGLPIGRAVVMAAKNLGIPTLSVQHGIYDSFSLCSYDFVADYHLVWGKYFKDLLSLKYKARNPESVYILGYPNLIKKEKTKLERNKYTLCYLGQDYERIDKRLLLVKLATIKKLNKICQNIGFKFIYRPHPGDDKKLLKKKLQNISFTPEGESLEETFLKSDILVGFYSTALIEATMRNKISLQLINYPIKSENFEKMGMCYKSFETIEKLEEYLREIADYRNLDSFKTIFNYDYIETRFNAGERFVEIIQEIEKNKQLKL